MRVEGSVGSTTPSHKSPYFGEEADNEGDYLDYLHLPAKQPTKKAFTTSSVYSVGTENSV